MMTLRHFAAVLALALVSMPSVLRAEEKTELAYDPAVSTLTGTLAQVKFEDDDVPALKGTSAWILKLEKPVSVKESPDNKVDEAEKDVKDVQLVVDGKIVKPEALAKLVKDKSKLTVKGKLFHGHTSHHVTKILIMVEEWKPVEAEKSAKP